MLIFSSHSQYEGHFFTFSIIFNNSSNIQWVTKFLPTCLSLSWCAPPRQCPCGSCIWHKVEVDWSSAAGFQTPQPPSTCRFPAAPELLSLGGLLWRLPRTYSGPDTVNQHQKNAFIFFFVICLHHTAFTSYWSPQTREWSRHELADRETDGYLAQKEKKYQSAID